MEGGSLLQEALEQSHGVPENTLLVNCFLLLERDDASFALTLAQVALALNQFLHQSEDNKYPWWSGGDGPVFGVHVTEGIPHLRGRCRYGVAVADEWKLVSMVENFVMTNRKWELAAQFWDVDDGDILLIEGSHHLPRWIHDQSDEVAFCQNRCWIRTGRGVTLIEPRDEEPSLSLSEALRRMKVEEHLISPESIRAAIRSAIQKHTRLVFGGGSYRHRAAILVPRAMAKLLSDRPDLGDAACSAFWELAMRPSLPRMKKDIKKTGVWDDWVWTTHSFGRIHFAVLRNLETANSWSDGSFTTQYRSPQLVRMQSQASFEATPHLHFGAELGVRLVAGLDYLVEQYDDAFDLGSHSLSEFRALVGWQRIISECSREQAPELSRANDWLARAWHSGPNESDIDLNHLLKCPVYSEEIEKSFTPLSYPGISISSQIKRIRNMSLKSESSPSFYPVPLASDVDSEDWLDLSSKDERGEDTLMNDILGGVKSFIAGESGAEGVSDLTGSQQSLPKVDPTVFLNVLYKTLKAKSSDEMQWLESASSEVANDPFFSTEDYLMMEDSQDDNIQNAMNAMDHELEGSLKLSRQLDAGSTKLDVHVLTNFVESLEAGAATAGPVRSLVDVYKGSE